MTEYQDHPIKVERSTSDRILPGRGKIRLRLKLYNNSEGLFLNLHNVYYLSNSPCNLVSLGLLNNSSIYYDNVHKTLYQVDTRKTLT